MEQLDVTSPNHPPGGWNLPASGYPWDAACSSRLRPQGGSVGKKADKPTKQICLLSVLEAGSSLVLQRNGSFIKHETDTNGWGRAARRGRHDFLESQSASLSVLTH